MSGHVQKATSGDDVLFTAAAVRATVALAVREERRRCAVQLRDVAEAIDLLRTDWTPAGVAEDLRALALKIEGT